MVKQLGQVNTGQHDSSNPDLTAAPNGAGDSGSNSSNTPKRGRGRPKGSRNKPKPFASIGSGHRSDSETGFGSEQASADNPASETSITVQEQKPRRGRPRKVTPKAIENPGEVSRLVLDKFEELVSAMLGDDARFQPTERFLLEIGMQDTIGKMSPETVAKVTAIITPAALVAGTAMYGFRMAGLIAEKQAQKRKQSEPEFYPVPSDENIEQTNPASDNGYGGGNTLRDSIVPPYTNLGGLS